MYECCNGTKLEGLEQWLDHVWKLQCSKKTRNSAKANDFAKSGNSGKRLSLEVNKMIFDVATLYNMYQNGNLDVQASQWYYLYIYVKWQKVI